MKPFPGWNHSAFTVFFGVVDQWETVWSILWVTAVILRRQLLHLPSLSFIIAIIYFTIPGLTLRSAAGGRCVFGSCPVWETCLFRSKSTACFYELVLTVVQIQYWSAMRWTWSPQWTCCTPRGRVTAHDPRAGVHDAGLRSDRCGSLCCGKNHEQRWHVPVAGSFCSSLLVTLIRVVHYIEFINN